MGEFLRQFCKWLVEGPRLDRMARRRLLHFMAFVLLLLCFHQVVSLDMTFLFGMDLGLLLEISAGIFLLAARDKGRFARHVLRHAALRLRPMVRRGFVRAVHTARSALRLSEKPDDDPAGWIFA
jgi:hypothetical protein